MIKKNKQLNINYNWELESFKLLLEIRDYFEDLGIENELERSITNRLDNLIDLKLQGKPSIIVEFN